MTQQAIDHTARLCEFLSQLAFSEIPARIVARAQDLVLDHLGVAMLAADFPETHIVRAVAIAGGTLPESSVYGSSEKVSRAAAALVNGVAAHSISLDDTHVQSFSHPGAVVIPAALAVAEAIGASPQDFLAAVVVGYEAHGRAGAAAKKALSKGFHPTSAAGVFGAAAAVAHLLKLDARGFESAFGLALSCASGVMQFSEDAQTNVKRLHAGWPAQNGLMAAQLAAAGMRGPARALDGKHGFIAVFAGEGDAARLTSDLGKTWEIEQMCIKLYACCRFFHSAIDALDHCRQSAPFTSDDVASISVRAPAAALQGRMQYRPQSIPSAQYSLPYAMANALLLDPKNPDSFNETIAARDDFMALMDRVTAVHEPALDVYLPAQFPGGVKVTLKDGRTFDEFRADSLGTPEFPLSREQIVAKFHALIGGTCNASWQANVVEEVFALGDRKNLESLMKLLRQSG